MKKPRARIADLIASLFRQGTILRKEADNRSERALSPTLARMPPEKKNPFRFGLEAGKELLRRWRARDEAARQREPELEEAVALGRRDWDGTPAGAIDDYLEWVEEQE